MNKKILIGGMLLVLPLVAVFAFSFGKDPHRIDSPLVDKPAPAFELQALGGGAPVALASLKGKPVVLNFWATWCGPCQQEHHVLQQASQYLGSHVQFVGVVYDDEEARIRAFLDQYGSGYPTLVDKGGKAAIAYGVYGVPETFFIDRTGTIVSKFAGPLDPETLIARVMPLMGEAK